MLKKELSPSGKDWQDKGLDHFIEVLLRVNAATCSISEILKEDRSVEVPTNHSCPYHESGASARGVL